MSYKRKHLGRREREARKRHRRGRMSCSATNWEWLKLGRKHHARWWYRSMSVADNKTKTGDKNSQGVPKATD